MWLTVNLFIHMPKKQLLNHYIDCTTLISRWGGSDLSFRFRMSEVFWNYYRSGSAAKCCHYANDSAASTLHEFLRF